MKIRNAPQDMGNEVHLCNQCGGNVFILNDAMYPKCWYCGNDLGDVIEIEIED